MRWMLVAIAAFTAAPSAAEEVTLRAVSAFAFGTTFSRPFEAFIQWVNTNGEGTIQIDLRGGPETMSPFEVGNAVSTGVVDIVNSPSAYYTGLVPAGGALHLATNTIQDQRANGCFEQIDAIHREQMNVKYLARTGDHIAFHLYLTKRIEGPDLSGLMIRTTPVYRAMFEALDAILVRTAPGDVYTALEIAAIDGYGWPLQGVFDLGWEEQTKYRVDPGFYQVDLNFLVNLDTWNALDETQRAVLERGAEWIEAANADNIFLNAEATRRQVEAGIEIITFDESDTKRWLEVGQTAGWAAVAEIDPGVAAALRACLLN